MSESIDEIKGSRLDRSLFSVDEGKPRHLYRSLSGEAPGPGEAERHRAINEAAKVFILAVIANGRHSDERDRALTAIREAEVGAREAAVCYWEVEVGA